MGRGSRSRAARTAIRRCASRRSTARARRPKLVRSPPVSRSSNANSSTVSPLTTRSCHRESSSPSTKLIGCRDRSRRGPDRRGRLTTSKELFRKFHSRKHDFRDRGHADKRTRSGEFMDGRAQLRTRPREIVGWTLFIVSFAALLWTNAAKVDEAIAQFAALGGGHYCPQCQSRNHIWHVQDKGDARLTVVLPESETGCYCINCGEKLPDEWYPYDKPQSRFSAGRQ